MRCCTGTSNVVTNSSYGIISGTDIGILLEMDRVNVLHLILFKNVRNCTNGNNQNDNLLRRYIEMFILYCVAAEITTILPQSLHPILIRWPGKGEK